MFGEWLWIMLISYPPTGVATRSDFQGSSKVTREPLGAQSLLGTFCSLNPELDTGRCKPCPQRPPVPKG